MRLLVRKLMLVVQKLKTKWLARSLASVGQEFIISKGVRLINAENISIGNNVFLGEGAYLNATHGHIVIGNNVAIGPFTRIYSWNHKVGAGGWPEDRDGFEAPGVVIGNDVLVGGSVLLLAGTKITNGVVVGAGAILRGKVYSGLAVIPSSAVST